MADHEEKPTAAQAYMHKMNETLNEICDLVGMSQAWTDPDAVRRRVKDIRTERDTAQARVKELEQALHGIAGLVGIGSFGDPDTIRLVVKDMRTSRDDARVRVKELEAKIAGDVAINAAREMRIKDLEDELLKVRASKCLDAMDAGAGPVMLNVDEETAVKLTEMLSNLSSAGIKVEPAIDPARAELAQIWELWGAGRPMTPGCVYEAAQEMERTATALRVKLGAIAEKLNDARIPTHYGRDQKGGPVPLPERVGLLIDSHESARMLAETWESSSMREAAERMDAAAVLSDLGAPSHAGAIHLTTAAQILALPGLLRQE